jgi:hypothetical protein
VKARIEMMRASSDAVLVARLSIQRALLGEISEKLWAVTFSVSESFMEIRFYLNGDIDDDDVESASRVEADVLADYEDGYAVSARCFRLDASRAIVDSGLWVFKRRERRFRDEMTRHVLAK